MSRMTGIRTGAAAELLGVRPSTLRSWERRLGYPRPERSPGNHREYDLAQLEALRDALQETANISSAIEIARRRGRSPGSPARLLGAFDRFDEAEADRAMEASLALRSVERTVEELLLAALSTAAGRDGRAAELEFGCRWATGWLHGARRLAPPASRAEGILLLDSATPVSVEAIHSQALELCLRRAGLRVLLLSAGLAEHRLVSALRALAPVAVVLLGPDARLDVVGPAVGRALAGARRPQLFGYRGARLVSGRAGLPALGASPAEATAQLLRSLASPTAR
jgi:MerR family transcriptional regulator, light-induced transcriptional regulator